MARRGLFGWGYGLKGKQDKVSEYEVPELWRQRLIGYLGPQLILIILAEMILIGRGLFVLPLLLGLVLTRRIWGLVLWLGLGGLLGFFALTGAWWPVWWHLSFVGGPRWEVKILNSDWMTLPGVLAAIRLLVAFIFPSAWGLATGLASIRGALEQVAPEIPNTPLTPVALVELLDLFGWARGRDEDEEEDEEERRVTVVHNVPVSQEVSEVARGVNQGGGEGRGVAMFPTEWFAGEDQGQKLNTQTQFAQYVLGDIETRYSRSGCQTFFESDLRARWFFQWMQDQHYATQVNRTQQTLTRAGVFVLRAIAEEEES